MEILGLSVVWAIFSFIKQKTGKRGIVGEIINAAGGEAMEELLEGIVLNIFPKGVSDALGDWLDCIVLKIFPESVLRLYGKSKKYNMKEDERNKLKEDLERVLKSIFDPERREDLVKMLDFLSRHESKFDFPKEDLSGKASQKAFKKLVQKFEQDVELQQLNTIHPKKSEELICAMYDLTPGTEVPCAMVEIVEVVSSHTFSKFYIDLDKKQRELAKVIEYMITNIVREHILVPDEGLTDEVKAMREEMQELRGVFATILQHEDGEQMAVAQLRTKMQRDPFYYIKLSCPECGAPTSRVHREGDTVYCMCCGNHHDIIRNAEPEVLAALKETEDSLKAHITAGNEDLKAQCQRIAEGMVRQQYMEIKLEDLKNRVDGAHQDLADRLKRALDEKMGEKIDALAAKIGECQRNGEDIMQVLADKGKEMQEATADIRKRMMQLDDRADNMFHMLEGLIEAQEDEAAFREKFEKALPQMFGLMEKYGQSVENTSVIREYVMTIEGGMQSLIDLMGSGREAMQVWPRSSSRCCPNCGREAAFKQPQEKASWECELCGTKIKPEVFDDRHPAGVDPAVVADIEKDQNNAFHYWIGLGHRNLLSDPFTNIAYDRSLLKIEISPMLTAAWNNRTEFECDLNNACGGEHVTVILHARQQCRLRYQILRRMLIGLRVEFDHSLKKVVLSDAVQYDPCDAPEDGAMLVGNVYWVYDKRTRCFVKRA